MNILLIGSGGREHAFAWKLQQDNNCKNIFIAPGNAGTALLGTNLNIDPCDFAGIAQACIQYQVEMILVGPEEPLVKGIYDYFKNNAATRHIHVIGPSAAAAQLEGSKAYAKDFMKRHNIPTAAYAEFTIENYTDGIEYISNHPLPVVLKADGLAAGKGVVICQTTAETLAVFESMIIQSKFGEAGKKVVIEEFLKGIELSVFALVDGKNHVLLPEAKDYKRIGEGDSGLNTGGMGAVSPVPFATKAFMDRVKNKIIQPTIEGLQKDNLEYKGFIFFGLISIDGEPVVIEYNCRMGDPETETVMPRIKNSLLELLLATSQQQLNKIDIETDKRAAATIIAVSGGYPGEFKKDQVITGLSNNIPADTFIFHAGTKITDGKTVTNGGRVLAITSLSPTITEAVTSSLDTLGQIQFDGMYFRKDIGFEFY
ncbi:MAG: phosphoribosylamine--glycine ligase [Chitinophagaceae bacterium]|nr:phosphoribosylamine--glycine ligase [Chitinophagaceae bacterium]